MKINRFFLPIFLISILIVSCEAHNNTTGQDVTISLSDSSEVVYQWIDEKSIFVKYHNYDIDYNSIDKISIELRSESQDKNIIYNLVHHDKYWQGIVSDIPQPQGLNLLLKVHKKNSDRIEIGEFTLDNPSVLLKRNLDFRKILSSTLINNSPIIRSSFQSRIKINPQEKIVFIIRAYDPDDDSITIDWTANGGQFSEPIVSVTNHYKQSMVIWTGPRCGNTSLITKAKITDDYGNTIIKQFLPVSLIGGDIIVCNQYVDIINGDDNNSGSKSHPLKTIQAGVNRAYDLNGAKVYVAEGTYESNGTVVTLKEGVSLYGGYYNEFNCRNIASHASVIKNTNNSDSGTVNAAVNGGKNLTKNTTINGFRIIGGGGPKLSAGIYSIETSPRITYCRINGGSADKSYGIYMYKSFSVISENAIIGGTGTSQSAGIRLSGDSVPEIKNNGITGGDSQVCYGIRSDYSSPVIIENSIDGGLGKTHTFGITMYSSYNDITAEIYNNTIQGGVYGSEQTRGLYLENSSPFIRNNTIDGGNGSSSKVVIEVNNNASPYIDNNIIFFSRSSSAYKKIGIEESGGNRVVSSLRNNNFFNCTNLYYNWSMPYIKSIDELNTFDEILLRGDNISVDPSFNDMLNSDWHLTKQTPQAIVTGGINGISEAWTITTDRSWFKRPELPDPWAIGAYELHL